MNVTGVTVYDLPFKIHRVNRVLKERGGGRNWAEILLMLFIPAMENVIRFCTEIPKHVALFLCAKPFLTLGTFFFLRELEQTGSCIKNIDLNVTLRVCV